MDVVLTASHHFSRSFANRFLANPFSTETMAEQQSRMRMEADNIWESLPLELVTNILERLCTRDLLQASGVCRRWRDICNNPARWRTIVVEETDELLDDEDLSLVLMCEEAIRRSQGGCVEFTARGFGSGQLISYLTDK